MTKADVPRAQQEAGRGRQAALRQSAQHRGGLVAPARSVDHRVAAAAFLRLRLGRDERDAGRDAIRHAEVVQEGRASRPIRCGGPAPRPRSCSPSTRDIGAERAKLDLRHRRRRLQGRPPRLAAAARLRVAHAALGDRAQVRRRARGDHRPRHRDPGRPHRRADAGRQARAGHRRRRGGAERDLAQSGRDRAARRADRRHRDDPARRRRDPAGGRGRAGQAARSEALSLPEKMPVPAAHRGGARGDRRRRGGRPRPLHRRVRLSVPAHPAPDAFRLAPRLRHRRPRREADRAVLRGGLGQGAGRHLHAAGARQEDQSQGGRGLRRNLGPQSLPSRSRRAGRSRWSASSMRSASAMSARPRRWRSPAATARGRRSTTPASRSSTATRKPRPRWMRSTRSARP